MILGHITEFGDQKRQEVIKKKSQLKKKSQKKVIKKISN